MFDQRAKPVEVQAGDQMFSCIPTAFAASSGATQAATSGWGRFFKVLDVLVAVVRSDTDLPTQLGKSSPWMKVRRLKFFRQLDADFSDLDAQVEPLLGDWPIPYL
jgi:hypothetical protein